MYKVYYNHKTHAHSIMTSTEDVNDLIVYEGTIEQCKAYLKPLDVIYLTIKN